MSLFKSVCLSLLIGVLLMCNISMAQESESADELYKKGMQYYEQQDYQQAMQWYLKAADKGHIGSMAMIGTLHGDINKDYQQAMQWYLKAANKGDDYSIYYIGRLYEKGLGVQQDYFQAMFWYLRAADKNNRQEMMEVSRFYYEGLGVKPDYQQSQQWFQKAKLVGK